VGLGEEVQASRKRRKDISRTNQQPFAGMVGPALSQS
jgi:hypothetical protein